MPKRTDIHSVLIIGAGPIIIGQACEFDYSGTQACKALQEEGYRVVLVSRDVEVLAAAREHVEIADAMRSRKARTVARLVRGHIANARSQIENALR